MCFTCRNTKLSVTQQAAGPDLWTLLFSHPLRTDVFTICATLSPIHTPAWMAVLFVKVINHISSASLSISCFVHLILIPPPLWSRPSTFHAKVSLQVNTCLLTEKCGFCNYKNPHHLTLSQIHIGSIMSYRSLLIDCIPISIAPLWINIFYSNSIAPRSEILVCCY